MSNFEKLIVVIDDEKNWADRFKDILSEQGYKHVDVQYGVKKFADLKGYDLAVIDIKMPRFNGFQIKDYFKNISPNTKVLLTSQYEDFGLALLNKALGADGWIEKKELDGNEMSFITLVEELLSNKIEQENPSKNYLLNKIIINNINEYQIKTVDQTELKHLLAHLKEEIEKADVANRDDTSLNVDQIGLELSKKKKDKNYIINSLYKISKAAGSVATISNIIDKIVEIINKVI